MSLKDMTEIQNLLLEREALRDAILDYFKFENIHPYQSSYVENISQAAKIEFIVGEWVKLKS